MSALDSDEKVLETVAFRLASLAFARNSGTSDDLLVSDQILDVARRGIARAAKQRNSCTRLESAVPAEVLGLVFAHLDLERCITASHICRMWRSVAFATPALWTRLDTFRQGVSYAIGQLERTGALPLTVRVYRLTPSLDEVLARHMWHVKELYFGEMWYLDHVCACLGSSAPALDVLRFSIEKENPITLDMFPVHQTFPALTTLAFQIGSAEDCDLPGFLTMCPSLRKLELDIFQLSGPGTSTGLGLEHPITSYTPQLDEIRVWSDYEVFDKLLPHLRCVSDLRIGPWCEDDDDDDTSVISSLLEPPPDQLALRQHNDAGRKNDKCLCILARSPGRSRMLVPARSREVNWVLSDRVIMANLVSLIMSSGQWLFTRRGAASPAAPALQTLTIILESNRQYSPRPYDEMLAPRSYPALHTVCIGDIYPLKRLPFVTIGDVSNLLCKVLGFTPTRKLPRLAMVNAMIEKAITRPSFSSQGLQPRHEKTALDAIDMSRTVPPTFIERWEHIHDVHWDGLRL